MIVVLCTGVAGVVTLQGGTTYTSRASLIASSSGRSPDQDAVLVQGYVDYFNDASYQDTLRQATKVPGSVELQARTAAASPIVIIEATSADSSTVVDDVKDVTLAFRDDMNRVRAGGNKDAVASLQAELTTLLTEAGPNPRADQLVQISDLQTQIRDTSTNSTNQLQELVIDGGYSTATPPLRRNLAAGFVGGLILGVLAALLISKLSSRVEAEYDLEGVVDLPVLADIPGPKRIGGVDRRALEVKQLANLVIAEEGRPLIITVTTPNSSRSGLYVAKAIADYRMELGDKARFIDAGQDLTAADAVRIASAAAPSGSWRRGGPENSAIAGAADPAESEADVIVVAVPPVNHSAEAQVLCASASTTLLVVDRHVTKIADTVKAVEALNGVNAPVLGLVIITPTAESSSGAE